MTHFPRIGSAVLDVEDPHQLFQDVEDHYHGCVGGYLGDSVEDLEVPTQVRVVCRLWLFLAEIGGGGIRDYLWNHCFRLSTLRQIHADLGEVGARSLQQMLEAGIRITLDRNSGEFLGDEGAREWCGQFENTIGIESDKLNELSCAAAYPEGSAIVANYIRKHADRF